MSSFTYEEIEQIEEDVQNQKIDYIKLLKMLKDYKLLLEFKLFEDVVNKNPITIDELLDACKAYARWYGYTQCNMGLQKILFLDGWRKDSSDECELFLHPIFHSGLSTAEEMGMEIDEEARMKMFEDKWGKTREEHFDEKMGR